MASNQLTELKLCSVCSNDFPQGDLQHTLETFKKEECEGCALIVQGIYECVRSLERNGVTLFVKQFIWRPGELRHPTDDPLDFDRYELFVRPGDFNPLPNILRTKRSIPGYTGSDSSVSTVRDWIRHCDSTHTRCGSTELDTSLPTRLISVDPALHLVMTKGMYGRYACLSHCWGKQDPTKSFRTTRKNFESRLHAIEFDSLPATYMDAVTFTRKLGIRYLWIDSLCIIQDNEDDWRHEASEMANIYENAVLTLGATASASSAEGLFRSRSPLHKSVSFQFTSLSGANYPVYIRKALHHYLGAAPLLRRGWVFQERFLSPRFLNFANNELIWECREGVHCECREVTDGSRPIGYKGLWEKHAVLGVSTPSLDQLQDLWSGIISEYTELTLTYPKDVFPAISGIVKKFMVASTWDEYFAGLWKSSFTQNLCWRVSPFTVKKPRPAIWRAPSWSWASVNSATETPYNTLLDRSSPVKVLQINCIPIGEDFSGEISSAYTVLRGMVMDGYLRKGDREMYLVARRGREHFFHYDYDFNADDGPRIDDGTRIICLLVGQIAEYSNKFLLVLREKSDDSGKFERIGLLESKNDYYGEPFVEEWETLRKERTVTII